MELHRELFTVQGEFLGERLYRPSLSHAQYPVLGAILYCGFCGDVWAKRSILPADGYTTEFFAHRAPCERCGDGRLLSIGGGSPDLHNPDLSDYPPGVLSRELAMYARMFQDPKTQYWIGDIPLVTNPMMKPNLSLQEYRP